MYPKLPYKSFSPKRQLLRPVWAAFFLAISPFTLKADIHPAYEVATWHGFRTAAITYTFDDNTPSQFSVAVPMFNEFDYRMTLYPVINWNGGNWQRLQDAADAGHEIGSHTVSHPSLGGLSTDRQIEEMGDSKALIEENVSGQLCLTIAYPNCSVPDIDIASSYFIAGRICSQQIIPSSPSDFFRLSSIIVGTQGAVKTAADFETRHNQALNQGGWAVYLIHAIDNDSGYSPIESSILRESLEYLDERREAFWVDSFVNVVRYIQQREAVRITELSADASRIVIELTDDLDDEIYTQPLTIRRVLPEGWSEASVSQNGEALESSTSLIDGVAYLVFDAVPDQGDVVLENAGSTEEPVFNVTVVEALPSGSLKIRIEGRAGSDYRILGSGDLVDWTAIETVTLGESGDEFVIPSSEIPQFLRAEPVE